MSVKSELSDVYFEQYRRKLKERENLQKLNKEMELKYSEISSKLTNADRELNAMRRVITKMIDDNIDPVEAQLSIDESNSINIWTSTGDSTISLDISNLGISSINSAFDLNNITLTYDD